MNAEVKKTCDLIVENRDILKNKMFWELDPNTYAIMAALINASRGVTADADRYKECKKILRSNVSFFSEMRGIPEAAVITRMTLSDDPEGYAKGVLTVYKKLRSIHVFTASPYMVMAAMNIYEHDGVEGADAGIERLEELYKDLKRQHPFLIFDSDRGYLSMITSSGLNVGSIIERTEASYEICKKVWFDKDAVHSMSQVLALSDKTPDEQLDFVNTLIKSLKEEHSMISRSYGMTVVGALAMLNMPAEQLAAEIAEASEYLHQHRGFKWFNQEKRLRTTYAALAVFIAYAGQSDNKMTANISTNITMVIIEEIIMMIVIMSITSQQAANSSSSSN